MKKIPFLIQKIPSFAIGVFLAVSLFFSLNIHVVAAAKNNTDDKTPGITNQQREDLSNCDGKGSSAKLQGCLAKNPIVTWTLYIINFLAAGAGLITVIMIIVGGIQYAAAGDNPQAVQAAKQRITNALLALLAFFFLYAFIQYLVPGGVF